MVFQGNPEAIPFGMAAALAAVLAMFAWARRRIPCAPAFCVMMLGESAWSLFECLELATANSDLKHVWNALRLVGIVVVPPSLLAVVLTYTGRREWVTRRTILNTALFPALTVLAAWTNGLHHLFWARTWVERTGGWAYLETWYGPWFWVNMAYCYAIMALAMLLLFHEAARTRGLHRIQVGVLIFGASLPWLVNIADMSDLIPETKTDVTAMSFALTGLIILPAISRLRLLDIGPAAKALVFEGLSDPVVVLDESSRVADMNAAAERLFGLAVHDCLGRPAAELLSRWPESSARASADLAQLEGATLECPDGDAGNGADIDESRVFEVRVSRLGGPPREEALGQVLLFHDVTDQHRADRTRRKWLEEQAARAEAEAANRAKDRLLAVVSHELRTPLTPVLATVSAMLDAREVLADPSLRRALEIIRRNVLLEARLIDDLLDLSRAGQAKLHLAREVVDVHTIARRAVEVCLDDIRSARLHVVLDLGAARRHVDADPTRVQQVLWNLIKNAVKFTPANGTITIRTRDAEDAVVVEVTDTGMGIEPKDLAVIFDAFEQGGSEVARARGGLGLGLAISRAIARAHGGELSASSPGRDGGSTFRLELASVSAPVESTGALPGSRGLSLALEGPKRPLRILFVEDNDDTRDVLTRLLSLHGFDVRPAADLHSALAAAGAGADLDLLISDLGLPDGSGYELVRRIHEHHPLPAIAMTGYGSADDVQRCHSAGFTAHVTKPVDFPRLLDLIQQVAVA